MMSKTNRCRMLPAPLLATGLLLAAVLPFCGTACRSVQTGGLTIEQRNAARGKQLFEQIYRDYVDERRDVIYITNLGNSRKVKSSIGTIAGPWHTASLLHAGIAILHHYPNDRALKRKVDYLFEYMNWFVQERTDDYLAYAVSRGPAKFKARMGETAFDDQAYIAEVYYDGYVATGEQKYLDLIEKILRFVEDRGYFRGIDVYSGEEIGAFSWGEPFIGFLGMSTTGLMAKVYLDLYSITDDPVKKAHYLEMGVTIYNYIRRWDILGSGMVANGIFWPNVSGNEYRVGLHDLMYHTYNNGTPIETAAKLYAITGEQWYLEEARIVARAARSHFTVDTSGYPAGLVQYKVTYADAGHWFTMSLFEGYLHLAQYCDEGKVYVKEMQDSLDYAYDNYFYRGYLPTNYVTGWEPGWVYDEVKQILYSVAPVIMYGDLAKFGVD